MECMICHKDPGVLHDIGGGNPEDGWEAIVCPACAIEVARVLLEDVSDANAISPMHVILTNMERFHTGSLVMTRRK